MLTVTDWAGVTDAAEFTGVDVAGAALAAMLVAGRLVCKVAAGGTEADTGKLTLKLQLASVVCVKAGYPPLKTRAASGIEASSGMPGDGALGIWLTLTVLASPTGLPLTVTSADLDSSGTNIASD